MTHDEIITRLRAVRRKDLVSLDKLASDIAGDTRKPLVQLSRMLSSIEGPITEVAQDVLEKLGALSILPSLSASRNLPLNRKVKAIEIAFTAYQQLVDAVARELDQMFSRKSELARPPMAGPVEEPPPVRRECDEAYMLAKRLRNPDESWRRHVIERADFARLSESERDVEIQAFRSKIR